MSNAFEKISEQRKNFCTRQENSESAKLKLESPNKFMTTWKSKFFGDNRFNFYGWIVAGILLICVSVCLVIMAIHAGALNSASCLLLRAIYFVVLGQFCIALQNYHARVAKKIEEEDAKKIGEKPSHL